MDAHEKIEPALRRRMEELGIDVALTLSILDAYNRGEYDRVRPIHVAGLPEIDGSTVIDFTGNLELAVPRGKAAGRLEPLLPRVLLDAAIGAARREGTMLRFDRTALRRVGVLLLPRVAYGVLNGGSATSYADTVKNRGFNPELFSLLEPEFELLAGASRGRPKGVAPAFLQPDGTPGPSFLVLKLRALLLLMHEYLAAVDAIDARPDAVEQIMSYPPPLAPFFQMTSAQTDADLAAAYEAYRDDPLLSGFSGGLWGPRGLLEPLGAVQPLIAAYTHGDLGRPKRVFTGAFGREGAPLPLPGGHGQSFAVLAGVYRKLRDLGKRYVYLGNVDNLGCLPDPVEVAYLALSGAEAGFDFAWKTPVDVKGGVLVRDDAGRLTCADIGPAVSREDVDRAEESGTPILFNAATGLFDLDWLVPNVERIARELPTRFTDQEKDAGRYSQAEQVTWEVIGMIDRPLVFSVRKHDRFLAAKLLVETLMTSGTSLDDPAYPTGDTPATDLRAAASALHQGLVGRLGREYGLRLAGGRWESSAGGPR